MKTTLGIIFGGRSGEHEISIRSAAALIGAIDKEKYDIVPICISKDGHWLNPSESAEALPEAFRHLISSESGHPEDANIGILGDTRYKGISSLGRAGGEIMRTPLDVVFPVLHGTFGEDGTIQGIFEMAGIPYVGCGVLASAGGMDKVVMKTLFKEAGLPICKHAWFLRSDWEDNNGAVLNRIEKEIGYPCFVKPANLGSSVGVSMAGNKESLRDAINTASKFDRKIVVEEAIDMREIECAVIGNKDPRASLPGEYVIRDKNKAFLDYTEKYSGTGNNEFIVPAPVSDDQRDQIQQMAITAFKAIDGSGLARVDFFLTNDKKTLLVNEINTMPGLTDASGFPKMWEGSGLPFSDVIDRLLEYAMERHEDNARNQRTIDN